MAKPETDTSPFGTAADQPGRPHSVSSTPDLHQTVSYSNQFCCPTYVCHCNSRAVSTTYDDIHHNHTFSPPVPELGQLDRAFVFNPQTLSRPNDGQYPVSVSTGVLYVDNAGHTTSSHIPRYTPRALWQIEEVPETNQPMLYPQYGLLNSPLDNTFDMPTAMAHSSEDIDTTPSLNRSPSETDPSGYSNYCFWANDTTNPGMLATDGRMFYNPNFDASLVSSSFDSSLSTPAKETSSNGPVSETAAADDHNSTPSPSSDTATTKRARPALARSLSEIPRPTIERLWLTENNTLVEVKRILRDNYNVNISESTLKRRFRQWGLGKYHTAHTRNRSA